MEAAARREGCGRVEIWGEEHLDADWPEGEKFIRGELRFSSERAEVLGLTKF